MSDSQEPVDNDLEAFEAEFFGTAKPTEEVEEVDEVDEIEEDSLATDEDDLETDEDEDESDLDEEEDEPEPEVKPKKKSAQERINEITARAYEAERREAALLARLEALEGKTKEEPKPDIRQQLPAGAPTPDAVDDKGEPVYPLGEFDPQFIADLTRFTIRAEYEAERTKAQQEEAASAAQEAKDEIVREYTDRFAELAEEVPTLHEDVRELTSAFAHVPEEYGEYLAMTIMSMDNGPRLMHYLSQNIGEAQKIVASGPAAATLALGRLDAMLTKPKSEGRKVQPTAAPKPPESRARGSGGKFTVSPDTDDLAAFERVFYKK
jgi:chemotaxis protein histidine kinase CheA